MDAIRVGVIGVGKMGERHCRVYSSLRGAVLTGVADLDAGRGGQVASRYGTRYFSGARALLREVEAVTIATTTPAHYSLVMEALEHGLPVLVEKPLTETVSQGEELVSEATRRGLIVQMGHIERFNPAYIELKSVIENFVDSGKRVIAVNLRRLSPFDTSNVDVDVIKDLMIHDIDLVSDLCGKEVSDVSAWGRSLSTDAVDHAVANLSFDDGPICTLIASRITEQKVRAIEVIVEGAYVEADLLGKSLTIHRRTLPKYDNAKYRQESIIERIQVPSDEPLMLELRHFVDCIRREAICRVTAKEGLHALQLAQAVADQVENWPKKPSLRGGTAERRVSSQ